MKKLLAMILCAVIAFSVPVYGSDISVLINGNKLLSDTPPIIVNSTTMIPLRAAAEAMGADVRWAEDTQTATFIFPDITLYLVIGSSYMQSTDNRTGERKHHNLAEPAQIRDGRSLVPLRAISEALGCSVDWDEDTRTVFITTAPSEAAGPVLIVSSREELLNTIGYYIQNLEKEFTITLNGPIMRGDYEINIFDHFYGVYSYETSTLTGRDTVKITYRMNYMLSYLVSEAFRTGSTAGLNPEGHAVYNAARDVIDRHIRQDMSDYEKEKAIHDFIVLNASYDLDVSPGAHSPYGILINKKGVCDGYSQTFKMFMDILGIECDIVYGQARNEPHSWNRVKLDDYYLVDVTWNDPVPDRPGEVAYNYFNVTDAVMSVDHIPRAATDKVSNSTRYNYFYFNNLVVESQVDFDRLAEQAIEGNSGRLSLLGRGVDVKTMLENSRVFKNYPGSINYSVNESTNTITIRF